MRQEMNDHLIRQVREMKMGSGMRERDRQMGGGDLTRQVRI